MLSEAKQLWFLPCRAVEEMIRDFCAAGSECKEGISIILN